MQSLRFVSSLAIATERYRSVLIAMTALSHRLQLTSNEVLLSVLL